MAVQRFSVVRRALVGANAAVAAFGIAFGVASIIADRPWGSVVALLLLGAVHGAMAFVFGRQQIVLTDDEFVATQGLRRDRVAWSDIERVHLDWSAEAAGRDRDVVRIRRRSGTTVRSGAAAGLGGAIGGAEAARLEAALHGRAEADGFAVEVTVPSWVSRASGASSTGRDLY